MEDSKKDGAGFNFQIPDFDSHIETSIPSYTLLISQSLALLGYYINVQRSSSAYLRYKSVDLGCTTGKFTKLLNEKYADGTGGDHPFIGLDIDLPDNLLTEDDCQFFQCDITKDPIRKSNTYTSFFTLQFLNRSDRKEVLEKIWDALPIGGSLIIAEKVILDDPLLQSVVQEVHAGFKNRSFSGDDIIDKWAVLSQIMFPVTETKLEQELSIFKTVQCFWRSFNFVAYICIK